MSIIDHAIAVLESVTTGLEILQEYNPYHDSRGRFAGRSGAHSVRAMGSDVLVPGEASGDFMGPKAMSAADQAAFAKTQPTYTKFQDKGRALDALFDDINTRRLDDATDIEHAFDELGVDWKAIYRKTHGADALAEFLTLNPKSAWRVNGLRSIALLAGVQQFASGRAK